MKLSTPVLHTSELAASFAVPGLGLVACLGCDASALLVRVSESLPLPVRYVHPVHVMSKPAERVVNHRSQLRVSALWGEERESCQIYT